MFPLSRGVSLRRNPDRQNELQTMKRMVVSQLNTLQMLRDDIDHGAAKSLVVSKASFRRLVYERQTESDGLPQLHRPISKDEFLKNFERYRTIIRNFLAIEIKAIPFRSKMEQPEEQNPNTAQQTTIEEIADSPDPIETEEECSVCRNGMIDTTVLSDCVHQFCYDCIIGWLTKGSGTFCPMCKTPVKYVSKKDSGERITIEQILAEKEPEATASEDLITEKRIVSRKMRSCRRLMIKIDELIGVSLRRNPDRQNELQTMKRMVVSQLNTLQMLRDDIDHGAAKSLVVSKASFRRLVYERQTESDGLPQLHRPISKDEFLKNFERYRTIIRNFLAIEIKAIPFRSQPKVDNENIWYFHTVSDMLDGKDNELIDQIINLIVEVGPNDIKAGQVEAVFNGMITGRVAVCFISQLRSLLNSKMSYLEWCGSVRYRSHLDRGGEAAGQEVVVVDDTVDDNHREENGFSRFNRRVFAPFDRVFDAPFDGRNNFVSPTISALFGAPLRLDQLVNTFRPQAHVRPLANPTAGIPWSQLTSSSLTPPKSSKPNQKPVPIVNLNDDDDDDNDDDEDSGTPQSLSESDDDDIQVVDSNGTIVLGDTPDCKPGPSTRVSRKRRSEELKTETGKKAKMELPEGIVDDVKKLLEKYNVPTKDSLSVMVDATLKVLDEKRRNLLKKKNESSSGDNARKNTPPRLQFSNLGPLTELSD
uniref:RING-type domain-containing protein n=2 Tax=Caenorhabditis japonica TaxID=281687 RepID=A0A8R1EGD3_CAEJA